MKGVNPKVKRKPIDKETRKKVWAKYDGRCAYCGCQLAFEEMQVDHIVSLKKGGTSDIENLNPSCRSCNHYKSTLTLEQFRNMVLGIPDRLARQSVPYQVGLRFNIFTVNPLAKKNRLFYYEKQEQKNTGVNDEVHEKH